MHFITLWDYLLLPVYLVIIYFIAYRYRNRAYPEGHPWRIYFIPGLSVKIIGAIFIGLLYQYYYRAGDTANYFLQSNIVNSLFFKSPLKWLNLIFHIPEWYDSNYIDYISQLYWYRTISSYTVVAITAIIGFLTFNTFLPTSILFAALSFTGIWALFRTFADQYPHLVRPIAIVTLFIPSTFVWGSGIFKDTICMFAMGWMLYGTFTLLIKRKLKIGSIMMMMLSFYLISVIKIYILLAFIPAVILWIFLYYSQRIRYAVFRVALKVMIFAGGIGGFVYFSTSLSGQLGNYSLDNITATSTITREYINSISGAESSGYNLGKFEPTTIGMLSQLPKAVNVALFRPYLWEAKKPIVLFNALEAFLFLLITLRILLSVGPRRMWIAINKDANVQFCLIFTVIFAFAVGISSGNFGALSRYRIPCLPTYGMALVIIFYRYNDSAKKFLWFR